MPMRSISLAAVLLLAASACSRPEPPEKERPPEPQATELRDTIRPPIDRAKAVDDQVQAAAAKQRAAIDAQTGG